ncbi:MAG: hypothetical protein JWQ95_867 [Sphaerisporangium sp.]|jgi:ribosome-associated protein|nr:hypothetical protein [Sphaerisporangium sp.]
MLRGVDENFLEDTFQLRTEYIPLCDLLKYCSVTESGGEAKHFIAEGNVMVDGDVELRKTCKIRAGQVVSGLDFEIHVVAAPDPHVSRP